MGVGEEQSQRARNKAVFEEAPLLRCAAGSGRLRHGEMEATSVMIGDSGTGAWSQGRGWAADEDRNGMKRQRRVRQAKTRWAARVVEVGGGGGNGRRRNSV